MQYFSLKNRTIFQLFLLTIGILGMLFSLKNILRDGFKGDYDSIMALILFALCIWSSTAPPKEKQIKPIDDEDILDSNF